MKRPKKEDHAKDRLSELPESLIIDILRFLPLTDVVRTTVLSKHWKNMWTTFPWLDFDCRKMENKDKFREFVNGALSCWRGTKISRFSVVKLLDSEVESDDDINPWVRFAVEKHVEDLYLVLRYASRLCYAVKKMYSVAQDVYSCSSLKKICFGYCNLEIHGNVQWYQLKSLTIFGGCISEEAMNKVLCGSPRLERLYLKVNLQNQNENLNISSSSLKHLAIDNFSITDMEDMEVIISTPNLEYLEISGHGYSKCLLMNNMPSLREAILHIWKHHHHNFAEVIMTQILPVIKHVERVFLSDICIEVLGGMKEKPIISSFPNANSLEIRVCRERYGHIVDILQMFPQLRHLLLNISWEYRLKEAKSSFKLEKNAESSLNFDTNNLPSSFLMKLRTIEVTCAKGDVSIIPLIQILLLKCASNLEKLVFLEEGTRPRKILLKVQRSSPDEELIFDHTKLCIQQSMDAA